MVNSKAKSVEEYLKELPEEKRAVISKVRDTVRKNLPGGYTEGMNWGMITWGIPLEKYPDTYNGEPLGYAALAAQKNHFALYLMCVYQSREQEKMLKEAFKKEGKKLDMGKSCLRFKTLDDLPLDVIGKVIASTPPEQFIAQYEASRTK